jgi:hypothetical protein
MGIDGCLTIDILLAFFLSYKIQMTDLPLCQPVPGASQLWREYVPTVGFIGQWE